MDILHKSFKKGDNKHNKSVVEGLVVKSKSSGEEEFFNLVGDICDYIYHYKLGSEEIRNLLEPLDDEEDLDAVVIMLCRDYVASKMKVRYIVKTLRYLSDIVYMLGLAFYKKNETNYSIVAENLLYSYEYTLKNEDIDSLLENMKGYIDDTKDKNTQPMILYLHSKKVFDPEVYEKPYWVSLNEGENISLLKTISVGSTYDAREEVNFEELPDYAEQFFYEFIPKDKKKETSFFYSDLPPNIKESISTFLKISNESEERDFKMKIGSPERVWGPLNRILDKDCCAGPQGKGPCRMLLCECLENEDDDEIIYNPKTGMTWFGGRCQSCNKIIADMSHALRFPRRQGGWKGCYCSFECMIKDPPYTIEGPENILLNITKTNINAIGIMDRSSFS